MKQGLQGEALLSLEELCGLLRISVATGRNWLRLGKLAPDGSRDGKPAFSRAYGERLAVSIAGDEGPKLKQRRNKRYVQGAKRYRGYLAGTENQDLLDAIPHSPGGPLPEGQVRLALACFAIRLFLDQDGLSQPEENPVPAFREGRIPLGACARLVGDLLEGAVPSRPAGELEPLLRRKVSYVPSQDLLGFLYLSLKGLGARKAQGMYFTPAAVGKAMADRLDRRLNWDTASILDPACGSGGILLALGDKARELEQLHGRDTDPLAIQVARINLALLHRPREVDALYRNLVCADSLFCPFPHPFDLVVGNPPWACEYSSGQRDKLAACYRTARGRAVESYDLFVERAVDLVRDNGTVAFVLPEAFLHVEAHREARRIAMERCSFSFAAYLGNAFAGVQCPSLALGLIKDYQGTAVGCRVSTPAASFVIRRERLPDRGGVALDLSDGEQGCLEAIEGRAGTCTLKDRAVFALGIVTGDNRGSLGASTGEEGEMVLRGSNIFRYRYIPSGESLVFHPPSFQQSAPAELYRAPEKLFYRFICDSLVFAYDDRQTLSLNSCNILIPKIAGLDIKYVLAALNSSVASFYWSKRFRSVKVLRSHLEQIPIPRIPAEEQVPFVRIVDRLLAGEEPAAGLWGELDAMMTNRYGLGPEDRAIVARAQAGKKPWLPPPGSGIR